MNTIHCAIYVTLQSGKIQILTRMFVLMIFRQLAALPLLRKKTPHPQGITRKAKKPRYFRFDPAFLGDVDGSTVREAVGKAVTSMTMRFKT